MNFILIKELTLDYRFHKFVTGCAGFYYQKRASV